MQQKTLRSYEITQEGTIFTKDIAVFLDDNGNELARGNPQRTPYEPAINVSENGDVSQQKNDISKNTDATLVSIAGLIWTDTIVQASMTLLASKQPQPETSVQENVT